MYTSFTVKNYRCFDDLTIEPLARVNLIAGKNNVGKTALLEALFIYHGADPNLLIAVGSFRGLKNFKRDELFSGFNAYQTINILGQEINHEPLSLNITIRENAASITQGATTEILFQYSDISGKILQKMDISFEHDKLHIDNLSIFNNPRLDFLLARSRENPKELAVRLSKLRLNKKHNKVIKTLQIIEPRLKDIEVGQMGDDTLIYGDIGKPNLIPIQLMGEGVIRLLEIALAIPEIKGGILLIDEIENGLHYSVMSKVWQAISNLAKEYNVQIFATTHSWECIQAAYDAFAGGAPDDFHFCRLERIKGTVQAVNYGLEDIQVALDMNWEMR